MHEPFRMNVRDVFRFENGTTVLVGEVTEGPEVISAGTYELFVGDRALGSVRIDGERSKGRIPDIRSVGVTQTFGFDCDRLKGREAIFAVLEPV